MGGRGQDVERAGCGDRERETEREKHGRQEEVKRGAKEDGCRKKGMRNEEKETHRDSDMVKPYKGIFSNGANFHIFRMQL